MENNTKQIDKQIVKLVNIEDDFNIVKVENFLSLEDRKELFDTLCKNKELFMTLSESTTTLLPLKDNPDDPNYDDVRKGCKPFFNEVSNILPKLKSSLDIELKNMENLPFNFMNGLDGHYGSAHADDYGFGINMTVLYYFHSFPKQFTGGDLELYAKSDMEEPTKVVNFEDNILIAFPSSKFHGVSKVLTDSNNFEDGRFIGLAFLR